MKIEFFSRGIFCFAFSSQLNLERQLKGFNLAAVVKV